MGCVREPRDERGRQGERVERAGETLYRSCQAWRGRGPRNGCERAWGERASSDERKAKSEALAKEATLESVGLLVVFVGPNEPQQLAARCLAHLDRAISSNVHTARREKQQR